MGQSIENFKFIPAAISCVSDIPKVLCGLFYERKDKKNSKWSPKFFRNNQSEISTFL